MFLRVCVSKQNTYRFRYVGTGEAVKKKRWKKLFPAPFSFPHVEAADNQMDSI